MNNAVVRFVGHQIAVAVAYLHRIGVVHRDLKPPNILLTVGREEVDALAERAWRGEPVPRDVVLVADLGLCAAEVDMSAISPGDDIMPDCDGTVPYMAPEAEGRDDSDLLRPSSSLCCHPDRWLIRTSPTTPSPSATSGPWA